MRRLMVVLLGFGFACGPAAQPAPSEPVERAAPAASSQPARELRPQPKPGERVRQPELDGYCGDAERGTAFYYHGGQPVARRARNDGCSPLYLTECEAEGRCYPPRDQEPGMWCCAAQSDTAAAVHAAR